MRAKNSSAGTSATTNTTNDAQRRPSTGVPRVATITPNTAASTVRLGKIVARATSAPVAVARARQSDGTIKTESAPYASAIAKSGAALKSSVFVSIVTGDPS